MRVRFIPFIAALATGLLLVAPSVAAPPAGTSVSIDRQATFLNPMTIIVHVVVVCPAGTTGGVQVGVSQPAGGASGFGFQNVTCTGSNQHVNVTVFGGPFTPGAAFAGAESFDNTVTGFDQDQRVIAIS